MNKVRSGLDERKGRKEMELNEFKCRMCGACCRINSVKPEKCRTFPFEWTNPDSAEVCPVSPREAWFRCKAEMLTMSKGLGERRGRL